VGSERVSIRKESGLSSRLTQVPTPQPGPGQLLVRMHATGVNRVETYIRAGTYAYKPALPYTPGNDGAGTCRQSIACRLGPLSFRRRFIARLDRVLLGHVLALPRSAVKPRACPVINTGLRVDPHLTMAPAWRGWVSRFLGRAPCSRWSCGRRRFPLSLRFLGSGFCLRRSRW
jgi:hypothetical protein